MSTTVAAVLCAVLHDDDSIGKLQKTMVKNNRNERCGTRQSKQTNSDDCLFVVMENWNFVLHPMLIPFGIWFVSRVS